MMILHKRFVNGFVEKVNNADQHVKKYAVGKKHSVHELADAIGIPRIVVDIRHESSHRDLPSLPILRLASAKALEWLKSNYWESQRRMIPDVRNEVVCRLYQLAYHIKAHSAGKLVAKHQRRAKQLGPLFVCNKLSSQISAKLLTSKNSGPDKPILKTTKVIMRLYSVYPMEVVSSILGIYWLQTPVSSASSKADCFDSSNPDVQDRCGSTDDLKVIITKLSRERPGLLIILLKEVLGMIEANDIFGYDRGQCLPKSLELQNVTPQQEHLSLLVPWLLNSLKQLKQRGRIIIIDEPGPHLAGKDYVSKFSLKAFLQKCLLLSVSGSKHFVDSALLLAEMISDSLFTEKLRRLSFVNLNQSDLVDQDSSDVNLESSFSKEVDRLKQATLDLDALKSRLKATANKDTSETNDICGSKRKWTLAKSWTPCPIGMLPCSLGISPVLPHLDVVGSNGREENRPAVYNNLTFKDAVSNKRQADRPPLSLGNFGPLKKLKGPPEEFDKGVTDYVATAPMEGRLLINGIWREVGEEELKVIASDIRILVK